ncbi:acetate/propionate family kinase [Collimonas sp. NPDC087041]|uniref:acetate/propionate family kinase n=1 Tax=Collimonas sp. NPDC087041 TaxID=3363960 RepID=UPI0038066396
MKPANANVLTINGGSSSIKFALFGADHLARRLFEGRIEGIGLPQGAFVVKGQSLEDNFSHPAVVPDHTAAVILLMDWIADRVADGGLAAVAHRIVHGGAKYWQPQRITQQMIVELHQLSQFDPEHLPEEILLAEAFHRRFPDLLQIACFDTAFHHDMPRLAQLLPIPRRYQAKGARRYGFHGLSCAYLIQALEQEAGIDAAQGRVILAHLGSGASVTAVHAGNSMDTSMGLTPASGLPMSSRSGDLDPSVAWYLARTEKMSAGQFHHMINHEAGLLGISETSSDMRELLKHQTEDVRAAEAVALFCYQAKKWICALAGVLEGLDTLVFAGGIGENAAEIRSRICNGLGFIGIDIDEIANQAGAALISSAASAVSVRVIATDEESMIAQDAYRVLGQPN